MAASFMPPCAEAASSDEKAMGLELLVSAEMAQTDEKTGFLTEPSGLPPTIPDFGFLRELSTPLAVPGENGLMQAVSEPDESAVVITSAGELLAITGGNYRLDRDLDLSGIADWSGINVKSDLILDGQGHRVTGLSGSLFKGQSSNSALTVRNMIVETVEDGIKRKGIIIESSSNLMLDNCTVRGSIVCQTSTYSSYGYGGLAGTVTGTNSSITHCAFIGVVDPNYTYSYGYAGGIVGYTNVPISDCYVQGTVQNARYAGGVAGYVYGNKATVQRCFAELMGLSGIQYAGGIAGYAATIPFRDCCAVTAEGTSVSSKEYVGGIVGYGLSANNCWFRGTVGSSEKTPKYLGGIASALKEQAAWCYADAEVLGATSEYMGGVVGQANTYVEDCAARVIAGETGKNIGGIVGYAAKWVERCWAEGELNGGGGIAGKCVKIADCGASVSGARNGIVDEETGSVVNCYVKGPVTLTRGGIGGKTVVNCAVYSATCGTAGIIYRGAVSGCLVQDSTITGSDSAGGIVAFNSQVANCRVVDCTITAT